MYEKGNRKYCSLKCRVVPKGENIDGKAFGWLTVVKETVSVRKTSGALKRRFICVCKCGNEVVRSYDITNPEKTPSCGCFLSYNASNRIQHGMSKTKIFKVWAELKRRCYKKDNPSFTNYGAKGIKVCKRWESFENFFEDMGATYKEGLTIDRYPNQKGDYEPGNCRWATYKEQNRNLTSNKKITVAGYNKCIVEFSEILGCTANMISHRLARGWTEEQAVLGKELLAENINKIKQFYGEIEC